jgi:hypothetical protein
MKKKKKNYAGNEPACISPEGRGTGPRGRLTICWLLEPRLTRLTLGGPPTTDTFVIL